MAILADPMLLQLEDSATEDLPSEIAAIRTDRFETPLALMLTDSQGEFPLAVVTVLLGASRGVGLGAQVGCVHNGTINNIDVMINYLAGLRRK